MKRIFTSLFAFVCISLNVSKAQSLAVNNDGSTADASAILDVKSSSKGLLIPRVTATSSVTTPATGLIVYVTTGTVGFYYNAGTSGSPSWKMLLPADGNGSSLTSLSAANLTGTLPAISGANLTNLNAANLTGTLPAISGVNLTSLNAGNLGSGTILAARMPALTGDVTTTAGTVATTIANNAVTTTKIADNSVTVAKISTSSGTASNSTYLRGDGTWSTPSAGGGGSVDLVANITSSQSTSINSTIDIVFGTATTTPSLAGASYSTSTGEYTVGSAGGTFLVIANVVANPGLGWAGPVIVADGINYYGGAGLNSQYPAPTSRGCATAVVTLTSGKKIKVMVSANSTVGTMTNESRFTIVKLF